MEAQHYLLSPWLRAHPTEQFLAFALGDAVVVVDGVEGQEPLRALVEEMRGVPRTTADLAAAVGIHPDSGQHLVEMLRGAGIVVATGDATRPAEETVRLFTGLSEEEVTSASDRARAFSCFVTGEPVAVAAISGHLAGLQVRRAAAADQADLIVVAARTITECLPWNEYVCGRDAGQALLPLLSFNGAHSQCGPLVLADQSACLACYETRVQSNVGCPPTIHQGLRRAVADRGHQVQLADAAMVTTAAWVVHRWVHLRDPEMPGVFYREYSNSWTRSKQWVLRHPRCRVCIAPTSDELPPVTEIA